MVGKSISTNNASVCGIHAADGRVLCWGWAGYGILGSTGCGSFCSIPTYTSDSSAYISVGTGSSTTCGIRASDGRVLCWGENYYGDAGTGDNTVKYAPILTTDSSAYISISKGNYHTCGIRKSDGRVLCWGYNSTGQLGTGDTTNRNTPTLTSDSTIYSSIVAGSDQTCGIRASDGRVLCWGGNSSYELGDGTTTAHYTAQLTSDSSAYSSISAGASTTCGIRTSDGRVLCWGNVNDYIKTIPTLTSDSSAYSFIIGTAISHICGIRASDGRVLCWGQNSYGQLGVGDNTTYVNPTLTTDSSAYSSLAIGNTFTCGIRTSDGRVLCWGRGDQRDLGTGGTTSYNYPVLTADSVAYIR